MSLRARKALRAFGLDFRRKYFWEKRYHFPLVQQDIENRKYTFRGFEYDFSCFCKGATLIAITFAKKSEERMIKCSQKTTDFILAVS